MIIKKNKFLFVLIVSITLLVGTSCQHSVKQVEVKRGIQAKDSRGVQVSLAKPAERIVVLFGPFVDELLMLQAGDRIKGVPLQVYQNEEQFSYFSKLDERIAKKEIATPTSGIIGTNLEKILSLKPDLVIVYESETETIAQLESLKIPVYTASSSNKGAIFNEFMGIATLTGTEKRGKKVLDYVKSEITKMEQSNLEIKNVKSVYYAWSKGRVFSTSGKGTLLDLAMNLGGTRNACPLTLEAPNVGAESLYKWNPDAILLWNSSANDVYDLKELASLSAVKKKQVYVLKPTFFYDPHTLKFLLLAKELRHLIYSQTTDEAMQFQRKEVLYQLYGSKADSFTESTALN